MDEMIAFLRTRLDEDERRIQLTEGPGQPLAGVTAVRTIVEEWCQTIRLRDEVKRRMGAEGTNATDLDTWCRCEDELLTMDRWIRLLALPYAWHTDFKEAWREEWRPRA
jgi:hypothetical protein